MGPVGRLGPRSPQEPVRVGGLPSQEDTRGPHWSQSRQPRTGEQRLAGERGQAPAGWPGHLEPHSMGERIPPPCPSWPMAPGPTGTWGCAETPRALDNRRPLQLHQFNFLGLGGAGPEPGPSRGSSLTRSPAPARPQGRAEAAGRWGKGGPRPGPSHVPPTTPTTTLQHLAGRGQQG